MRLLARVLALLLDADLWALRSPGLQGSEETRLKPQHISTLVVSLAEFVRMADRKIIAGTLSQLKLELDFDSTAISQLQVVLFGFQDAVSISGNAVAFLRENLSVWRQTGGEWEGGSGKETKLRFKGQNFFGPDSD